ncbi:acyl-CoA desaturase [Actinoallomurus spadix]|uniref:Acyl-CoA desaturase n=1 Tax=Actinoallomurus spadix TaxID=79912 RepID=A0ABP3FI34_9ACTN|nr:acyl-CoA desaturase [Actinoallomurus spadix]MCO5990064.1 acyl-CoA desaturase [Actinoallomurus spadix]
MPGTATLPRSDFAPLIQEVRAAGLLDRRTRRYAASVGLDLLLYGAVFALVAFVGDSWWQLALALPAAVLTTRLYFVGHDAGHGQIAGTRRVNRVMGLLVGNLAVGLSYGWWTDKHNRHHANPNHVDKDPDVGVGVLVWTTEQAADRRGAVARWLTRNQGRLFFPLLLLEGFNLKVSSVRSVIAAARGETGARQRRTALLEAVLLAVHVAAYLGLIFTVMSPGMAVAFVLLHQAILGVHLGCSFAPNHKGMPMPGPGERWDHLRKQVLTSRNVRGGLLTDWFLGGLNYQIEHHLFPGMPRPNLRRAQPLVRAHCERLGLPYTEEGLIESYAHALGHLHATGAPLR